MVVIATYNSYLEAEMAKSHLQSVGIYVEIRDEMMSTLYPFAIPSQLLVRECDVGVAKMILEMR